MDPTLLNVAIFALLGFIAGWALEFVLDFLYWRRRSAQPILSPGTGPEDGAGMSPGEGGVGSLRQAMAERDEALLQVRRQAASRGEELASAQLTLRDYENTIAHLRHQLDERQLELDDLRATTPADELAARDVEIATLRAQLEGNQSAVASLRDQLGSQTAELEAVREQLAVGPPPGEVETLRGELAAKMAELEGTQAALEARMREAAEVEEYLQERDAEIKRLTALLSETSAELDHLRQRELDRLVIEETEYIHEDDLTDIKGIGDVYSERLREAGYYTFRHLADAEAEELKAALEIPAWRTPNLDGWIEQARELAAQKEQEEE